MTLNLTKTSVVTLKKKFQTQSDYCIGMYAVIELPHVREDSCGTVHDTLELVCCRPSYASQEAVAIVDSCNDERVDKRCC